MFSSSRQTVVRWVWRAFYAIAAGIAFIICVLSFILFSAQPWRSPTPPLTKYEGYGSLTLEERITLLQETRKEIESLAGRRKGMDRVPEDDPLITLILAVPPLDGEAQARAELFKYLRPMNPYPAVAFCLTYRQYSAIEYYLAWYRDKRDELLAMVAPAMFTAADTFNYPPPHDFWSCFDSVACSSPVEGSRAYCRLLDLEDRFPSVNGSMDLLDSIYRSGLRDEMLMARLRVYKAKNTRDLNIQRSIEAIETSNPRVK